MFDPSLFPASFSQYFTSTFIGAEELMPNEKLLITKFSAKRLKDFSTGRFCARKALNAIDITSGDILIGPDRQPLWPESAIGSISHSGKLTGAVVGLTSHFKSIGLDIETMGKVSEQMWRLLYSPAEQEFLRSLSNDTLPLYTTLLFSFKESFYKMQHPITKTFLEFTDVEVSVSDNKFELTVLKQFPQAALLPQRIPLFYVQDNDQVITLCYLS